MTPPTKVAYYFGCMALICPFWYGFTLMGALVGQAIPTAFSLDFAAPVCFIALTAPLVRSGPRVIAALVAGITALAFAWVPWSLGLLIAAVLGVFVGGRPKFLWLVGPDVRFQRDVGVKPLLRAVVARVGWGI